MKKLLLGFLWLFPLALFAQTLDIIEVDTSEYPIVSAKFIALDENFDIVKDLTVPECSIKEFDDFRNVIKVVNPKDSNIKQSVVLAVDISGSMGGTNIDLAKQAINEFIKLTPVSYTEISIVSFDTDLFVNQDFTRNKKKLLKSVENLRASGGTDYDVALIEDKNSALNLVAKREGTKPVVIFLTDGLSSARYNEISKLANETETKVYAITLNMPMPFDLSEITDNTGARYFENISTVEEAKKAYLSILFEIYDLYGKVYWETERPCEQLINFSFSARNKYNASYFYEISQEQTKGIYFDRQLVAFDPFSDIKSQKLDILANSPTSITGIKMKDSELFTLDYKFNLPTEINPGQSKELKITAPQSDKEFYTEVEVSTDVCPPKKFYIFHGNIANFVIPGSLILLTPNGGENFFSGSYTNIKWKNKTSNKYANLYYSTNNGVNYTWIAQTDKSEYNWLIPGANSDSCLVKVDLETEPILLRSSKSIYQNVQVSNSGNSFFTNSFKSLSNFSVTAGTYLEGINTRKTIKGFKLSPVSNKTLVQIGKKMYTFDIATDKITKIKHKKDNILDYYYFNNDKKVVVFYKNSNYFKIFNTKNGRKIKKIKVEASIKEVAFNYPIVSILVSNRKWIIWDLRTNEQIFEHQNKRGFYKTDVSYNGDYVVVADRKNNIIYWSQKDNDIVLSHEHSYTKGIDKLKFNPRNKSLLVYDKEKAFALYYGEQMIFNYTPPKKISLKTVDFIPNGYELVYSVYNRKEKLSNIYHYDLMANHNYKNDLVFNEEIKDISFNQSGNIAAFKHNKGYHLYLLNNSKNAIKDESDNVFSIKSLSPIMKDTIVFPQILAGSENSYLDTAVFYNPHLNSAVIDYLEFANDSLITFGLVSGVPPFGIKPKTHRELEFSIKNTNNSGTFQSEIYAYSGSDTLKSVLIVNIIKPPVEFITAKADLGTIDIFKTTDKSFELFENVTDSALTISKVVCWGPDYDQISLNNKLLGTTFQPGEKIKFNFNFEGKSRGYTNSLFLIYLDGISEPLRLNVTGKVYAAEKITVKCTVLNTLDNSPISARITYYNSKNNKFIDNFSTNSEGKATIKIPNELSYKFSANGVNTNSKIVDLTNIFVDTVINLEFYVFHVENGMKYNLQNANFDVGSSKLSPSAKTELNKLAELMAEHPEISVRVDGHTDNEGSADFNMDLSERRAGSVKTYLTSKGIEKSRINTAGYGLTKPVSNNNSDIGKAKNRRIEITIFTE